MYFVRVASVVHGQIAEHAVEADIGQVRRLLGSGLRLGLELGMLVNVWHGGYGAAAGSDAGESPDSGRTWWRRRLCNKGRSPRMKIAQCRARGAGGTRGAGVGSTKRSHAWVGTCGRFGAWGGWLGVEQNGLGHGRSLILGDDDAAVARVVEVNLRQRPVMSAARRQGRSVQGIGLAVGVVERVGLGIQQVSRVAFFRGRVEDSGRGGV